MRSAVRPEGNPFETRFGVSRLRLAWVYPEGCRYFAPRGADVEAAPSIDGNQPGNHDYDDTRQEHQVWQGTRALGDSVF